MYAADSTIPATVTVPPPTRDNPAAGTTGVPAGATARGAGRPATGRVSVPAGVLVWAFGGLAVVLTARAVFARGGLA